MRSYTFDGVKIEADAFVLPILISFCSSATWMLVSVTFFIFIINSLLITMAMRLIVFGDYLFLIEADSFIFNVILLYACSIILIDPSAKYLQYFGSILTVYEDVLFMFNIIIIEKICI